MDYFRLRTPNGQVHRVAATVTRTKDGIDLKFGFNEPIKDEVKVMDRARWNPTSKCWTVADNPRNNFAIDFLLGKPVFAPWDAPLQPFEPRRGKKKEGGVLMEHQCGMAAHQYQLPGAVEAAEMGTGKTLVSIEVLERLKKEWGEYSAWFVAPKVALMSVTMDYKKWKADKVPNFFTIHAFTQQVKGMVPGTHIPPRVLYLDEASKYKNYQAKCSQAAQWIADWMREYWKGQERVILMSGSPAPKSPVDWWKLCEIARPGFIREGNVAKFLDRVALVKKVAGDTGIAYPKIITFKDDENKCGICGKHRDFETHSNDPKHTMTYVPAGKDVEHQMHKFVPMANEVKHMYARLDGLVRVTRKVDCMELPEKVYRVIKLKPTKYMRQLAKMVAKTAGSAAQAMILLRELSDGFQYTEELIGTKPCPHCMCAKAGEPTGTIAQVDVDETGTEVTTTIKCIHCAGKKQFKEYATKTVECDTPKVQATLDILDEKDDGRIVIYGAFQGTIDRICATVVKAGWRFIRRDGRGWFSDLGQMYKPEQLIEMFQREMDCPHDRIAFVGHPGSCGMGLTLTASDTELYYSNSFNGEERLQSEDRIHRHGCRGANIIDFEHLPIDAYVRDALKKKIDLQSVTLGSLASAMEVEDDEAEEYT